MNFCMKKIIISALLLMAAVSGFSQDRKWVTVSGERVRLVCP